MDTITLSIQQQILVGERIKAEKLDHRVRVHLLDYRDLPENFESSFDACIAVEMIEVSAETSRFTDCADLCTGRGRAIFTSILPNC